MHECMYVNSREKSFMIFYKLLLYRNNMHECMYGNSREKSFTIFYDFFTNCYITEIIYMNVCM